MQTKAIVIKKQNTGEYDQWVTCYTEDFGKLKTVAKSILKPNSIQALHLDIFNLVEFDLINGRGMPIVTGAQVIDSFAGIKSSLPKTAVAYFFAEAVDKMVFENDKDEELWSFLVSFFGNLSQPDISHIKLFREGQVRLLSILGYFPEVNQCRSCGVNINADSCGAFNHVLGGMICKECFLSGQGGVLVGSEDLKLISKQFEIFESKVLRRSILDGMFEYVADSKFHSLELINMVK